MDKKVKLALIKQDLTIQDLADAIGRSKPLVSLILSGKHKGYEHRPVIAQLLGLSEKSIWGVNKRKRRSAVAPILPQGERRRNRYDRRADIRAL